MEILKSKSMLDGASKKNKVTKMRGGSICQCLEFSANWIQEQHYASQKTDVDELMLYFELAASIRLSLAAIENSQPPTFWRKLNKGNFYKQQKGTAISISMSHFLLNLFM